MRVTFALLAIANAAVPADKITNVRPHLFFRALTHPAQKRPSRARAQAPPAPRKTQLPGFGAPLTDSYSGYLDIGNGKHLHYMFFASQNNPATDVSRERACPCARLCFTTPS